MSRQLSTPARGRRAGPVTQAGSAAATAPKPELYLSRGEGDYLARWKRIIHLDARLRSGSWPRLAALAQECGVTGKTIRRDLEALRDELGAPIRYDSQRRGWGYSHGTFSIPSAQLSERDLFALMVAEQALAQYAGTPLHGRLSRAFAKILACLPQQARAAHATAARAIHFGGLPPPAIDPRVWTTLALAVERREVIRVEYRKHGAQRSEQRRLWPLQLLARERDWFLLAHDPRTAARRLFYLPRMRAAELTRENFEPPADFDPAADHRETFNLMRGAAEPRQVVLRFAPEAAALAAERPWAEEQQLQRLADGSVQLGFRTAALFEVERQVLRFGGQVCVLAPTELRAAVAATARRLAARHAGPAPRAARAKASAARSRRTGPRG